MTGRYITSLKYKRGGLSEASYLRNLPAVNFLAVGNEVDLDNDVTFFTGDNGTGKSTLIEAIAVCSGFNPEGGSKNFNFSTYDAEYPLAECITVSKKSYPDDGFFLRAESFYNVATNIDNLGVSGYGDCSLHKQSHGESFHALFQNRFRGNGLYLLDEPESALSPLRQMSLLARMHQLVSNNSQFIIATHSPILLSYPNATILEFSDSGIHEITYEESQSYLLYKQFLDDPSRTLKHLLE